MSDEELPRILRQMEVQCHTVLRAIKEWQIEPSEKRRDKAIIRIERSCLLIAQTIGVIPEERRLYIDIIDRCREEVDRLTRANIRLLGGTPPEATTKAASPTTNTPNK
jgi:hypothetical protein